MTDNPPNLSGIILAGGSSTRMGSDKALLDYGDGPAVRSLTGQLHPLCAEVLVVSSRHDAGQFEPVRIIPDEQEGLGPLMGVLSGLEAASKDLCFIIGCDTPRVNTQAMKQLCDAAQDVEIAVLSAKRGRIEPLHAVYRRSVRKQARMLLNVGERSVRALIESCNTAVVRLPGSDRLVNVNTPEDYHRYIEKRASPVKP